LKKLFIAIRKNDFEMVKQLLERKPELIACTAKQPPKKDDGQSPLQVSLKTGNFTIAKLLLDLGADVNFIETDPCCNEWRAPIIHDAINAAIMCSRWNVNSEMHGGLKVMHTKEEADLSFEILKKIMELGADVNALDSFGNSSLWRACLQARQILPIYNHTKQTLSSNRLMTEELRYDLSRIFILLFEYGADNNYIAANFDRTAKEYYKNEPLEQFLT